MEWPAFTHERGAMTRSVYPNLFKSITIKGLRLKNRITMAPLYLGYAADSGRVSLLLLHHYRRMAQSGAAMIVVENASITAGGSGAPRTLRCDHNRYLGSLEQLADTIKGEVPHFKSTMQAGMLTCQLR